MELIKKDLFMKVTVLLLLSIFCSLGLNAQELRLNCFKTVEDGRHGIYIFPKDFDKALEFLQDQMTKFLSEDAPAKTDILGWVSEPTCGLWKKADISYEQYWEERKERQVLIPGNLRERLEVDMLRRVEALADDPNMSLRAVCFQVYALVDKEGSVLSPFFWVDTLVRNSLMENELQKLCEQLMSKKIDVSSFDFYHRSVAQNEEAGRKMQAYLDRKGITMRELDFDPIEWLDREFPKQEADCGIIEICRLRREDVAGLDYWAWKKSDVQKFKFFTTWKLFGSPEYALIFPEGCEQSLELVRKGSQEDFVADEDFFALALRMGWEENFKVDWKQETPDSVKAAMRSHWGESIPVRIMERLKACFADQRVGEGKKAMG